MPRKIGGRRLTPAQVRKLDRIVEELKDKPGIQNPWAVAISVFKRTHVKTPRGWRKKKAK